MKLYNKALFLIVSLSGCYPMQAGVLRRTTSVRLVNNSPFDVQIKRLDKQFDTPLERGTDFDFKTGTLKADNTLDKVLWFERNVGIKNYREYLYDLIVELPYIGEVALQQKVTGQLIGSKLQLSFRAPSVDKPWTNDSQFKSVARVSHGTHTFIITYQSYFTGGADDILYTIDYLPSGRPG